ncbi:MAG TPA: threonine/serine dehydratase [Candidatus Angelobacter sp.]|nr:threonine/serine dehydratase [Candidatus Angelobacter sp.]
MNSTAKKHTSTGSPLSKDAISAAHERIRGSVLETPVEDVSDLFLQTRARVYFKMENLQNTGSFKLRGATNRILGLSESQAQAGVIAASNGNHGLGVAEAARSACIPAEVFVSEHVSPSKARRIEQAGAIIRRVGTDPLEAELAARAAAMASGKVFISPYNDFEVMAGQGTIAVELLRQLGQLDAVFVAVGGGGLIGGIGAYMKAASPQTEVVGCWPQNSPVLYESIRAGRILEVPEQPTVSESTAGGLEEDSVTLDVCSPVIDRSVLVSEDEILSAMRLVRDSRGWLIEGAAGVAVAAFIKEGARYQDRRVAIIICGGNLSEKVLARIE